MIRAGDSIENPVTGERIVFRQTSHETGGEAVVIETYVEPDGFVVDIDAKMIIANSLADYKKSHSSGLGKGKGKGGPIFVGPNT